MRNNVLCPVHGVGPGLYFSIENVDQLVICFRCYVEHLRSLGFPAVTEVPTVKPLGDVDTLTP